MRKSFIFAALALAAAVSCTKELPVADQIPGTSSREGYVQITLSAGMDASTKAALDGKTVLWTVGDEVAVYPGDATKAEKFTVKTVEGNSVTITGEVPEGTASLVAVYPYDLADGRNGNSVDIYIPESQNIPAGATVNPYALVSAAVYTDLEAPAQFKNLFSLVAMNPGTVDNASVLGIFAAGETAAIAGEFTATLSADAAPVVAPIEGGTETGVELFAETVFEPNTTYYAVVAPCTINGFTTGMGCENKIGMVDSEKTITLERNKGVNLGDISGKLSWKYTKIRNAAELADFLATSGNYTADDVVEFANDIDMSGVTLPACVVPTDDKPKTLSAAAESLKCTLDGKGFSIKNWTSDGVSLVDHVAKGAVMKGIVIDKSCKVTPDSLYFGLFANRLSGQIIECRNNSDIALTVDGIHQYVFGPIAGRLADAGATVQSCSNAGDISITVQPSENMKATQYFGGVVGIVGVASDALRLDSCTNEGDNLTVKVINPSPGTNDYLKSIYVGGIAAASGLNNGAAAAKAYGQIKNCVNKAAVSASWNGGTGGYFSVGGIIGASECELVSCTNEGGVSYTNSDTAPNAAPRIGGIAGALSNSAEVSAKDCVNKGTVRLSGMFSNGGSSSQNNAPIYGSLYACLGGCFGIVGDSSKTIENCDNYGKVEAEALMAVTAGSSSAFGGVAGYSFASLTGCDNFAKELDFLGMALNAHFGGIVGYGCKPITNCNNDAAILVKRNVSTLTNTKAANGNIAGIVAYALAGAVVSSCVNNGNITVTEACHSIREGGVAGISYDEIKDCKNYGTINLVRKNVEYAVTPNSVVSSVGGVIGMHNIAVEVSNLENHGKVDVTLDSQAGTANVGGVLARMAQATNIRNAKNTADISVDAGGSTPSHYVGGVGNSEAKGSGFYDCTNSGNIVYKNGFSSSFTYVGGVQGFYKNSAQVMERCVNTGNVTSSAGAKMRVGGLAAAMYGEIKDCSSSGEITVSNAAAGSRVGGAFGYASVSMTGGTFNHKITIGDTAGASHAGLLFGDCARENTLAGMTVDGQITSDENVKAGILIGGYNSAANPAAYTLGTAESPFIIKATATANGVAVSANPSGDADVVGDTVTNAPEGNAITFANVIVQ